MTPCLYNQDNNYISGLRIFLITVMLSVSCIMTAQWKVPDNDLRTLNEAIKHAPDYRAAKTRQLDSLKHQARLTKSAVRRFNLYMDIGNGYRTFNADSALQYFVMAENQAVQSGDVSLRHSADIGVVNGLTAAGFFIEATQRLDTLRKTAMPLEQRLAMWLSGRRLYSAMIGYVGEQGATFQQYRAQYLAFDDSLLVHLPHNSLTYRFIYAERLVSNGMNEEAAEWLQQILNTTPIQNNIYGKAAYQLAMVCRNRGDEQQYASYLTKAATSDVMGCVTEGWAMPKLAEWLYQNGKLDQAFIYINYALSEAKSGNARMRSVVISQMVPAIDDAYRKSLTSSRDKLVIYLCIATFLFVLAAILTVILLRQNKRSHETQKKITEYSRLQELYLGNFVSLCSTYSSKLQSWQKLVMRKLASGQTEDLLKTLKAGKLSGENEDFHSSIDKAFLELYPRFVEEINELLRTEEKMELKKKGTLPPELRILALLRLGVVESSRIAAILQYSANTVYAYRNKMRNKAIDRDHFEQQVRQIGYKP